MGSIILPNKTSDGGYKRTKPSVVEAVIFDVYPEEMQAIRNGKRGCSCDGSELTRLGEKCRAAASETGALSWSIYPLPNTYIGVPKVYVEFHNWREMGMCNPGRPVGKKRYWWDTRAIEQWIAPKDERALQDKGKEKFDPEA